MKPREGDTRRALAELRAAFSPGPADAVRVRAALNDQLVRDAPAQRAGRSVVRWTPIIAGAAALFAVWGYRTWATPVAPHSPPSLVRGASAPAAPVEAPRAHDVRLAEPTPATPASPRRRRTPVRRDVVRAPNAESSGAPTVDSTAEELRMLRRVEELQRDGQPERALLWLSELDRRVPGGRLIEERAAAFSIARCAADPAERVTRLHDFARKYPDSVYLARVERGCEKFRQSTAPADTSSQELPLGR